MAADTLAIIFGPLDERISGVEVELSALGLRGLSLEAVLRRDLPEVLLEDGLLRLLPLVLEVLRLRRRPEVQLALAFHQLVNTGLRLPLHHRSLVDGLGHRRGRRESREGPEEQCEELGFHPDQGEVTRVERGWSDGKLDTLIVVKYDLLRNESMGMIYSVPRS